MKCGYVGTRERALEIPKLQQQNLYVKESTVVGAIWAFHHLVLI